MVPSGSLLPVPFSVTVTPETTVWATPAFAMGGVLLVPPPPPLLPPVPPHAASVRAAITAKVRPGACWRIASLYRREPEEGSQMASQDGVRRDCFAGNVRVVT